MGSTIATACVIITKKVWMNGWLKNILASYLHKFECFSQVVSLRISVCVCVYELHISVHMLLPSVSVVANIVHIYILIFSTK